MLARIRQAKDENDQGFTLIELLVVMIIIGILAAIAIPTFLNQRNKAYDTQAKADVSAAQTEIETYFTDASAYPTGVIWAGGATAPTTTEVAVKKSANITGDPVYFVTTGPDAYCVSITSKSTASFKVSSATAGVTKGACTTSAG